MQNSVYIRKRIFGGREVESTEPDTRPGTQQATENIGGKQAGMKEIQILKRICDSKKVNYCLRLSICQ